MFLAYSHADAVEAVEKALSKRSAGAVQEITVFPGQEFFSGKFVAADATTVHLSIRGGAILETEVEAKGVKPYFNSFPLASIKPALVRQLGELGYELETSDPTQPMSFTLVHLTSEQDQMVASLTLAEEDEELLLEDEDSSGGGSGPGVQIKVLVGAITSQSIMENQNLSIS